MKPNETPANKASGPLKAHTAGWHGLPAVWGGHVLALVRA
jgi:hypothetical protein